MVDSKPESPLSCSGNHGAQEASGAQLNDIKLSRHFENSCVMGPFGNCLCLARKSTRVTAQFTSTASRHPADCRLELHQQPHDNASPKRTSSSKVNRANSPDSIPSPSCTGATFACATTRSRDPSQRRCGWRRSSGCRLPRRVCLDGSDFN